MVFKSRRELLRFLSNLEEIGFGSQGTCYYDFTNNKVYKIYNQYLDEDDEYYIDYKKEDIMRFSHIKNNTFIWSNDVIYVGDEVVGYVSKYVSAKSLYKINPLQVNLNSFAKAIERCKGDIKIISNEGVVLYDVIYNILYGRKIYVIDYDDYSFSDMDKEKLNKQNNLRFDHEIYFFLIENYFNEVVKDSNLLSELYSSMDVDVLEFIKEFRRRLSELVGHEIVKLDEASQYINKSKTKVIYQRDIF